MDVDEEFPTAAAAAANGGDPPPVRRLYSSDQLDLEAYAAQYTGRIRVSRLLFVADNCGSALAMAAEALRMAYGESREGGSACAALHRAISARIAGRLGPRYAVDQDWADAVDGRALVRLKALQGFTETGLELGDNLSKVIAPQDVAVYGGLCALASFDRSELKSKVIDNDNFHHFLELVPEVKELINDFYACRYASCMGYLEELKPNLLLDIYMHEHVETIYKEIRHKAIIHYTLPFISVDLNRMAPEFKTSVPLLEKELAALITENKIQARIDSHNKILYAIRADGRNETFQRVLQTCSEFERGAKCIFLRANLLKHGYSRREVGVYWRMRRFARH